MTRLLPKTIAATKPLRYKLAAASYTLQYQKHIGRLERFRNCHAGKPMLVVGNGPSLNDTPLEEFQAIPSIGMNKINMIFDRTSWRPSYIVCVNSLVTKQNRRFFAETDIPVFLSWKARRRMSRESCRNVNWILERNTRQFSKAAPMGVGVGHTVTYTALQLAFFMGADPVILVGVDHSFAHAGKPNEYRKQMGPDRNHFDPDYFKAGQTWGIPNLERSEESYHLAQAAFEAADRSVYDATVNGKLEVFPKKSIKEALRLARQGE